jgi:hypothetical protein
MHVPIETAREAREKPAGSMPIAAWPSEVAPQSDWPSLPRVVTVPADIEARAVSVGIHHKLCHTLGGTFNLPHAEVHTVILPRFGMPADGLERAAELATQNPYTNPRPVEYAGVLALLRNAHVGRTPWSAADAPVGSPEELL